MRKMWLILAGLCLAAAPGLAAEPTETPTVTPADRVLGKADAPVTIIEYGSPTCPHCAEFDRDTMPKVKEDWIDTGKAKLVFRIFPLNRIDVRTAMVASCIPPDQYYAFIHELYQSQESWARGSDPVQAMANIGRLTGAGDSKIKSCLADSQLEQTVVSSAYATQKTYGVESTPTFFVNGTKVVGMQSYAEFAKALTAAQPKS